LLGAPLRERLDAVSARLRAHGGTARAAERIEAVAGRG
jgi:hypothetical protein